MARELVAHPDLRGLTRAAARRDRQLDVAASAALPHFTVFEKTVPELQDAMARGVATSEDIVREYLARLDDVRPERPDVPRDAGAESARAIADARASDAERADGPRARTVPRRADRVQGQHRRARPADDRRLARTGGSPAAPRFARRRRHARAGAPSCWARRTSTSSRSATSASARLAGTIGNAYDPSLSTAGSSGGSATAVATSLAALGFGTDTCNSLSNPGGVRRAVDHPGDARAEQPRGRDAAQHLQRRGRPDGEDRARRGARARSRHRHRSRRSRSRRRRSAHKPASFAAGLDTATLKGARIGLLRQRFVGITGEREIADAMERVVRELRAAGATVVDVADSRSRREVSRGAGQRTRDR